MDTGGVKGVGEERGGEFFGGAQIQSCEGERGDVVDRNVIPPLEPRSPRIRTILPTLSCCFSVMTGGSQNPHG
jgi:hypothetical protein